MTLFSRKDIGFGRAVVFLLLTQSGMITNQTIMMEMKIVCISQVRRDGVMSIVIGLLLNLCVKSMLEFG